MSVILNAKQSHTWLESGNQIELLNLLKGADAKDMQAWPVSKAVNPLPIRTRN